LAQEAKALSEQSRISERAAVTADDQAAKAEAAFTAAAPRLRLRRAGVGTLKALLAAAGRLERALEALDRAVDGVETPLRARAEAGRLADRARAADAARIDAAVRAGRRRARPHQLARVLAGEERLDETLTAAGEAAARFEAPLRARVDAGGARTGELGDELR